MIYSFKYRKFKTAESCPLILRKRKQSKQRENTEGRSLACIDKQELSDINK